MSLVNFETYYQRNKEKVLEYKRQYAIDNKEKIKEYKLENRDKILAYAREYKASNKSKARAQHLKRTYGLTEEGYNQLFTEQNGKCKCCGKHQSELKRPLYVDHDHETKKVRGLLCHKCNVAIGLVDENTVTLNEMIKYLEHFKGLI